METCPALGHPGEAGVFAGPSPLQPADGLEQRELGEVLYIGLDELSRRKGQLYVTNVYDLKDKRLIWSGEGRSEATLEQFFAEHGEALKGSVKGVCCDMWQPYIDMVKEKLPGVTLVFDKFHIIQHLLQAVDEVRREEARELKKTNPELLQRSRYIWLKNPENLSGKQRVRLGHLEKLNLRSNRATYSKRSSASSGTTSAKAGLNDSGRSGSGGPLIAGSKPMRDFAWMLRRHQEDILNYFEMRIDNGAVEGMNNKAKVVSHRCYGCEQLHHCPVPLSRQAPRTGIGAQICVRNRLSVPYSLSSCPRLGWRVGLLGASWPPFGLRCDCGRRWGRRDGGGATRRTASFVARSCLVANS